MQWVVPQVQRQRARPDDGRGRRGNDDGLGDDLLKRSDRQKETCCYLLAS